MSVFDYDSREPNVFEHKVSKIIYMNWPQPLKRAIESSMITTDNSCDFIKTQR